MALDEYHPISTFHPGDVANIVGVVTSIHSGRGMMWVPGIGESGRWEIVGSALAGVADKDVENEVLRMYIKRMIGADE